MSVVDIKTRKAIEVQDMPVVFSDQNIPIFHHGDIVEIVGRKTIIGTVWSRSYGCEPKGIQPSYGVLPLGERSLTASVTASQDQMKISAVHYSN